MQEMYWDRSGVEKENRFFRCCFEYQTEESSSEGMAAPAEKDAAVPGVE